jgi:hypothetical protein
MTKPLGTLTRLAPRTAPTPREPASQAGSIRPHSGHALRRSQHYHAKVVPHLGGSKGQRLVDRLNPTTVVPAHRSFPGLAN